VSAAVGVTGSGGAWAPAFNCCRLQRGGGV